MSGARGHESGRLARAVGAALAVACGAPAAGGAAGPAGAAGLPDTGLACTFTKASIDGRAPFDSTLRARAVPVPGAAGLAVLEVAGDGARLAAVGREGVWLTLRTEPDRDHAGRVTVLDLAQEGPKAGLAVLVVSAPGEAAQIVTREGGCAPLPQLSPEARQ
jgi:hypothetical protein